MSCPDEDTFTRMQAGLLSPSELVTIHRHLDICPACLELAGVLGCLYDAGSAPEGTDVRKENVAQSTLPRPKHPSAAVGVASESREQFWESLVALVSITLAHAYFSLSIAPIVWRASGAAGSQDVIANVFGQFAPIVTLYVKLWGLVGLVWAGVGCWGLLTSRGWCRWATRSYAVLCLPTIVLAPLGLCVLLAFRQPRNESRNSHRRRT